MNLVGKCYKVVHFRKHSDFITEKTKEHIVARYVNGIGTCILLHTLSSQQQWLEASCRADVHRMKMLVIFLTLFITQACRNYDHT